MANTATSFYIPSGNSNYVELGFDATTLGSSWTIELWGNTLSGTVMSNYNGTHGFYFNSNGNWYINMGGTAGNVAGGMTTDASWSHYAACRHGDTLVTYKNGVVVASHLNTSFSVLGGGNVRLGRNGTDTGDGSGYFDAVRISEVARYGNIDIPTTQLNTWQTVGRGQNALLPHHTKLLIQANSTTTTSSTIYDESGRGSITAVGGIAHSQGKTLFGNTAIYFDGTDDYITSSETAPIGINNFSFECWFWSDDTATGGAGSLIGNGGGSATGFVISHGHGSNQYFKTWVGQTSTWAPAAATFWGTTANEWINSAWHHLVFCRVEDQFYGFMDGIFTGLDGTSGANISAFASGIRIGMNETSSVSTYAWKGYLDNIRLCVGQSAYTPNFIPYGGQKNLAVSRGGAVTDVRHPSANTHAIRLGQAAIGSTLATNANTYCIDLDGTADYLLRRTGLPDDTSGSFFAWIYLDATPDNNDTIFWSNRYASVIYYWKVEVNANGKFGVEQRANDTVTAVEGQTVATGGWHSIGITSDGTSYVFHYDGAAASGTATSGTDNGDWYGDSASQDMQAIGVYHASSGTEVGGFVNGKIMQIGLWSGTFSNTVMAALHSAGKGADLQVASDTYTSTQIATQRAYWRMGNHYLDTPQTIYDASGNGYDMQQVSNPLAKTWTTGTTFREGWEDRGYFTGDKYTNLLIQSAHSNNSTTFTDSGPGFKKTLFDATADYAYKTVANWDNSSTQGTILAWIKALTPHSERAMFSHCDTAGPNEDFFMFQINGAGALTVVVGQGGTVVYHNSRSLDLFVDKGWKLVGLTMSDSDHAYHLWVDGVEVEHNSGGIGKWFNDFTNHDAIAIGALLRSSAAQFILGQISQLAIWGGSSGTTGVLTAAQISAINDLGPGADLTTSYATGMTGYWTFGNKITEGTDTGSTIYDQSAGSDDDLTGVSLAAPFAGHTITATGDVHHSAGSSVFGGSSMYFDGTGDYLTIPFNTDWEFPGSFTIECWVSINDATPPAFSNIMSTGGEVGGSPSDIAGWGLFVHTNGRIYFTAAAEANSPYAYLYGVTYPQLEPNTWVHVAIVREGLGTITQYVNGIVEGTSESFTFKIAKGGADAGVLTVGREERDNDRYFAGYLDEIRISSGIARYTSSIERYANTFVPKGDTGDAFTYLQLNSNGAKNGTSYSEGLNRTGFGTTAMTIGAGNPVWVTTKGDPYGGANTALYFDGSSYLTVADNANHDFAAADDATFECWVNFDDVSITKHIFGCGGEGNSGNPDGWSLRYKTSTSYSTHGFYMNLDWASPYTVPATGPADNELKEVDKWYHCAITKKGTLWSLYTDGVLKSSMTYSPAVNTATAFRLGYAHDGHAPSSFKGYVDGFRISKGIVRYGDTSLRTTQQVVTSSNSDSQVLTSNSTFGSGTNLFTADAYTGFLLQGDGTGFAGTASDTFTDESASPGLGAKTVTNNGGVTLRQGVSAFGANSYYFDGTNDYLSVPDSTDFDIPAAGDWTLEVWINPNQAPDLQICGTQQYSDGYNGWLFRTTAVSGTTAKIDFNVWGSSSKEFDLYSDNNLDWAIGTWYHVAIVKSGVSWKLFRNGAQVGAKSLAAGSVLNSDSGAEPFFLGRNYASQYSSYYIDSIRISKGIARYGHTSANIKAGLNAVHHSHCKLLITSNTYSGNTHFDDFSDQGNYWDQTPYGVHFKSSKPDEYYVLDDDSWGHPLTGGTTMTLAAWVKDTDATASHYQRIIQWGNSSQRYAWLLRSQSTDGNYQFKVTTSSAGQEVATSAAQRSVRGVYTLVVGTLGAGYQTIYVNAQQGANTALSGTLTNSGDIRVGQGGSGESSDYRWVGDINQIGVWNTTLTPANVQAMWEAGPTANWMTNYSSGMAAYWAFGNHNEVGGLPADTTTILYDRSGRSRRVTSSSISNAPHKGKLIIPGSGARHSTDVKNFGSSAIQAIDRTIELDVESGTGTDLFGITTGEFTIESWVNNTYWYNGRFFNSSTDDHTGFAVEFPGATGALSLYWSTNGTSHNIYSNKDINITLDFSSWTHIVFQRKDGIFQTYKNGMLTFSDANANSLRYDGNFRIMNNHDGTYGFQGFIDEFGVYDVAKYNPVALPGQATITPSYLSDPSGNQFTTSGLAITDQMLDTPENNFCTLNPLHKTGGTYTEGNLKVVSESSTYKQYYGNMGMSSGKWYWECKMIDVGSVAPNTQIGIQGDHGQGFDANGTAQSSSGITGGGSDSYAYRDSTGQKMNNVGAGSGPAYGDTFANDDVIGVIVDMDNGKIWWSKNGVVQASGDPANGSGWAFDNLLTNGLATPGMHYFPAIHIKHDGDTGTWHFNFGQGDPDGENNFTDSNNIGGFRFEPPTDFLTLCTANMKDEDYASTGPVGVVGSPDKHFDTLLWSGNGDEDTIYRSYRGLNFKPDLVWTKARDQAINHSIWDSVRGPGGAVLATNSSSPEPSAGVTTYDMLDSFDEGGFTSKLNSTSEVPYYFNKTGSEYVAFCWKAGNGTIENGDGHITSTVSVNKDAGFSIVSWNNAGSQTNYTIGHGLDKAPEFLCIKGRNKNAQFVVHHKSVPATHYLAFNRTIAPASHIYFNNTLPTSKVFSLGTDTDIAGNSSYPNLIAYCWHAIEGYSKFGTFEGNGNADGPFIYLGFKPAWVLIKRIDDDGYGWTMFNNKTSPWNVCQNTLRPDSDGVEQTSGGNGKIDMLSNGFKCVNTDGGINTSDKTYIYMTFAEMPFKYATGR